MLLNKKQSIFNHSIWERLVSYLEIFVGWLFIVPFSFLIPKKKQSIVVIGKEGKLFIDNSKYFYLYGLNKGFNVHFVTTDKTIAKQLRKAELSNILLYPKWKTIWTLLQAEFLVTDSFEWAKKMRYFLLFRAKKIQLWHGVSSKKIGMENTGSQNTGFMQKFSVFKGILSGDIPRYKAIISTSDYFAEHLYSRAFRYHEILSLGQARNDLFFRDIDDKELIYADTALYNKLKEKQEDGYKIILYAPTFRDTGGDFIRDKAIDVDSFQQFCKQNKFCFVLKLHPYADALNVKETENFKQASPFDDIYPIMKLADMMITDYSSIYIDFLLIDKPTLFFTYDYDKYVDKDRDLRADFENLLTGPKLYTQKALEEAMLDYFTMGLDKYVEKREIIRKRAFLYRDGNNAERVFQTCIKSPN